MGSEHLLEIAAQLSRKARELDEKGKYTEAINAYLDAADVLVKILKITRNPELRDAYKERIQKYINRAKELRDYLSRRKREESATEVDELARAIEETIITEKPNIRMSDVADLENAKRALTEAIVFPILRPDLFKGARKPWRGILLYGPPGCGKTLIAKAVAAEAQATFFNVSAATLVSKWLGESERLVKTLFDLARKKAPSIVFIDEVDSIATARSGSEVGGERRLKTQFLIEMDGVKESKGVIVLGATNRPWDLDEAMRRRFEKRIYIPLPEFEARKAIFKIHTRGVEIDKSVDFDKLAEMTEGYSGADIALVCREALMYPIRELAANGKIADPKAKPRPVVMEDFLVALESVKPSVSPEEIKRYEEWTVQFAVE